MRQNKCSVPSVFFALQSFLGDKKLAPRKDYENRLLLSPLKWQQIVEENGAYSGQIGQF